MSNEHPATVDREMVLRHTPARLLIGRAGVSYRTRSLLELRRDHAAARDAVDAVLELETHLGRDLVARYGLFVVDTSASDRLEYLMRPDRGRTLAASAREEIARRCPPGADLQVVIGDGLSAFAVAAQVPALLPLLEHHAAKRGLSFGQSFAIRNCRVGILNELGPLLGAAVHVLLIGERPGLACAESLSAYMAFRPEPAHTDAHRNLVSNIHARGVTPEVAARRIFALGETMRRAGKSGVEVKEELPALLEQDP